MQETAISFLTRPNFTSQTRAEEEDIQLVINNNTQSSRLDLLQDPKSIMDMKHVQIHYLNKRQGNVY